jgi:protein pelota
MKLGYKDFKKGEVKLTLTNLDDLWYLSHIISPGDFVKGSTFRKFKLGSDDDRKAKIVKKRVFLKIQVEKVEFHKYSNILRVSGTVEEGLDDLPKGSYHTFNLEENVTITVIKKKWLKYQIDKLADASAEQPAKILICVFDRESAIFALMRQYGFEVICELSGQVQKKTDQNHETKDFYQEIIKNLEDYDSKHNFNNLILGSPAFFKTELSKKINNTNLKKKIIFGTCSSVSKSGINELLKRDELKQALQNDRVSQEMALVEALLSEISKDGLAGYGIKEVEEKANSGSVKALLITDSLINEAKLNNNFKRLDKIMLIVEQTNGSITIVSYDNEAGSKLNGLGGIAAILRY